MNAMNLGDAEGQTRVFPSELERFVREVLIAEGAAEAMAFDTAAGLVHASLRGVDSHGVRLLPHYVKGLRGGRINRSPALQFERRARAVGRLDADHAFGHHAGTIAMSHAMSMAKEFGVGTVAVANSSHCGALAFLALPAAEAGMIGIVMTHATPRLKTPGGRQPIFGNNPICVVAPIEGSSPFCFDAATSTSTFNAVRIAAERGEPLPPGVAADGSGNETTNPQLAEQLIPIGDYKGFGLSMVVDIFCGLLSGMPAAAEVSQMFDGDFSKQRRLGHFVMAFDVAPFASSQTFARRMSEVGDQIHSSPGSAQSRGGPNVPGGPENETRGRRLSLGIPIELSLLAVLRDMGHADRVEQLRSGIREDS